MCPFISLSDWKLNMDSCFKLLMSYFSPLDGLYLKL